MKILLLSDTHGYLDDKILSYAKGCDEIWHAGDIGPADVLTQLEAITLTRAVYGNIDGKDIRAMVPENLLFEVEGVKILMTHIGGYPGNYSPKAKVQLQQERVDLFICGHSHILKVAKDEKFGLLAINPGAAGIHGFHKIRTMVRMEISEKKIQKMEAIELGLRGKILK